MSKDNLLPIYEVIPALKNALSKQDTVILQAPPGAGKSTIVPIELLGEGWLHGKKIIVLEPRKIAARSVAARMSDILGEPVGHTVGYRVRFDNKIGENTKVEVLTEGILTRFIQEDNLLSDVGLVIFDEFHERSIHADLALALTREVQQVLRPDLKILIMSATLDVPSLSETLSHAPIVNSSGRQYPVQLVYEALPKEMNLILKVVKTVQKALKEQDGDVLVFLPGIGEISQVEKELDGLRLGIHVLPLHGSLGVEEQKKAIMPLGRGQRKVVLATSIAETSLTIEGVTTVIDSGMSRKSQFDPRSGLNKMVTVPVSQDAADQRSGRAGRLGPGVCYRLWDRASHQYLEKHRKAEILEADLAPLVLELTNWGQNDLAKMSWLTPPPSGAVAQAKDLLQGLGALNEGKITDEGKKMVRWATHPRLAHMFLVAEEKSCLALAADLVALLEERDPLGMKEQSVDLVLRLEYLRRNRGSKDPVCQRIEKLASEWRRLLKIGQDAAPLDIYLVGLLLSSAFPERIAKRKNAKGNQYLLANGRTVTLPDGDPLCANEWLVIPNLELRGAEGKAFLASVVDVADLLPNAKKETVAYWDVNKETFVAQEELRMGAILIKASPSLKIDEKDKLRAICAAISSNHLMLDWSEKVKGLMNRVNSLAVWKPEADWPSWNEEILAGQSEDWLAPYLNDTKNASDLKKLDLYQILFNSLPWAKQQELEKLAPFSLEVPSGFEIPLIYGAHGEAPVLSVRLQELFGLIESPSVCEGKVRVLVHLLSPGYKPVQITADLKSFWTNTYKEVKSELQRRYPKHSWPDDPFTAKAIRGVVRKNNS